MTAPIVQAEYDQLSLLAGWFRQEADQTQTLHNNLRRTYDLLCNGGWMGRGSAAFFNEMTSEVYPALVRLYGALEAGDAVLREISAILQAAEEEAAAPFRGNSVGAGIPFGSRADLAPGGAGSRQRVIAWVFVGAIA